MSKQHIKFKSNITTMNLKHSLVHSQMQLEQQCTIMKLTPIAKHFEKDQDKCDAALDHPNIINPHYTGSIAGLSKT